MKPEDLLPPACARMNCERSELLREASTELRFVSETLRAEARELIATARDIHRASRELLMRQRLSGKPTGSPQAVHSLSTGNET